MSNNAITVVSGLPRSGTSMMMQMLSAGGLAEVQDGIRQSDEDNPKGYYEYEKVKQLKNDSSWLSECQGRCIKIISFFLADLPDDYHYKIIFMQRSLDEIIRSQTNMLINRNKDLDDIDKLSDIYQKHLNLVAKQLRQRENIDVLYAEYADITFNAAAWSQDICEFLDIELDIYEMKKKVSQDLYRNRLSMETG